MTTPDLDEYLRKYGVTDMAPARKAKPPELLMTRAEYDEIQARKADAVYLGWPKLEPLHPDPLVCEIAEMLLNAFW